jgi:hypothetical protein
VQKKAPYRVRQVRGIRSRTPLIGRSQTADDDPQEDTGEFGVAQEGTAAALTTLEPDVSADSTLA